MNSQWVLSPQILGWTLKEQTLSVFHARSTVLIVVHVACSRITNRDCLVNIRFSYGRKTTNIVVYNEISRKIVVFFSLST